MENPLEMLTFLLMITAIEIAFSRLRLVHDRATKRRLNYLHFFWIVGFGVLLFVLVCFLRVYFPYYSPVTEHFIFLNSFMSAIAGVSITIAILARKAKEKEDLAVVAMMS